MKKRGKIYAFSKRNCLEIVRDPLSYLFCLGFPFVMLLVMTLINASVPPEAGLAIFRIESLSAGIAIFGLMFIMLFTCLIVSKDRSGAFLLRLYVTPMESFDFILGYMLPAVLLSVIQIAITFFASFVISLVVGVKISLLGCFVTVGALLPSVILMISFGLLFGTLFSEKAAPGLCSVIISLGSFLGGIWFDAEATGGVLLIVCKILPFYHSVQAGRMAFALDFYGDFAFHFMITVFYALVFVLLSVYAFRKKMRAD